MAELCQYGFIKFVEPGGLLCKPSFINLVLRGYLYLFLHKTKIEIKKRRKK